MNDSRMHRDSKHVPVDEIIGRASERMPESSRDRIRHNVLAQAGWGARPIRIHEAFVRAAALFVAVTVGLGGVGYASASSLPGSPLYPLKRAMEEARVALTVNGAGRASALMELTRERVQEVERLIRAEASEDELDEAAGGFGQAATRAVESEETTERAQQRVNEIEAEVEGAPATVRERVAEEVPGTQPDVQPDPPQSPAGPGTSSEGAGVGSETQPGPQTGEQDGSQDGSQQSNPSDGDPAGSGSGDTSGKNSSGSP